MNLSKDKVTEIFYFADNFCKEFYKAIEGRARYTTSYPPRQHRRPRSTEGRGLPEEKQGKALCRQGVHIQTTYGNPLRRRHPSGHRHQEQHEKHPGRAERQDTAAQTLRNICFMLCGRRFGGCVPWRWHPPEN